MLNNVNHSNFLCFCRQKGVGRLVLWLSFPPYFIGVSAGFLYVFAKIRINIEVCKFIDEKVPIVEIMKLNWKY